MQAQGWLDEREYPFEPRYFDTPAGQMHYVDEGAGAPIVFVHGNPSWSFEFRMLISGLSDECRCVAPDHIGKELGRWTSLFPRARAIRFADAGHFVAEEKPAEPADAIRELLDMSHRGGGP